MKNNGRDYRFIALTFVVGMISGVTLMGMQIKPQWELMAIFGFAFIVWAIALFMYMNKEN